MVNGGRQIESNICNRKFAVCHLNRRGRGAEKHRCIEAIKARLPRSGSKPIALNPASEQPATQINAGDPRTCSGVCKLVGLEHNRDPLAVMDRWAARLPQGDPGLSAQGRHGGRGFRFYSLLLEPGFECLRQFSQKLQDILQTLFLALKPLIFDRHLEVNHNTAFDQDW